MLTVRLGGQVVKVFLLVAVLSFSRRLFVRAFLNQRGDDWREGVAAAFVHFGGVPLEVLSDNVRPLVDENNRQAGTVRFHPAWVQFCQDWDAATPEAQGGALGPQRAAWQRRLSRARAPCLGRGLRAPSLEKQRGRAPADARRETT
ncbi:DDE-type integrase/transposase/recombinase [Pyxidicoccus xibeiensis]|uniref:DDE-type integrase/transposase/recombinase n=1 Tax=Pyxidicoccus xibeiensis TaxID=2906759 RepID=UPI0020A704AB|nr:DDE-type integrase/transposase/recombinase [Pyxidicoccus xibeiensis]MCP3143731.1 DDE-type integrase/transposase/recombinase [Pyxidicoccus xibeiensis]